MTSVAESKEPKPSPMLQLISVNVALPSVIGTRAGKPVTSAIAKKPVTANVLHLDTVNLEGDGQGDLRAHGGPDKAVYAYPSEHLSVWAGELGGPFGPASFGENLTTDGQVETDACIGDVWAWGEARLQISQPRAPCFKLAMHSGRPDLPQRLTATGRTGWYLRVLQSGRVPTAGPIEIIVKHPAGITVLAAHRAIQPGGASATEIERLLRLEPLAASWKQILRRRLSAADSSSIRRRSG